MLRSARKLLDTEADMDEAGRPRRVESAHRLSDGQLLQDQPYRLVMTPQMLEMVRKQSAGSKVTLDWRDLQGSNTMTVTSLSPSSGGIWTDPNVPHGVGLSFGIVGLAISLESKTDPRVLVVAAPPSTGAVELWGRFSEEPLDRIKALVVAVGSMTYCAVLFPNGDLIRSVAIPSVDGSSGRAPERNVGLVRKRIAVVGCGSMGSKLAATLARAGANRFLLVDDDVLRPGNLVRHDLNWVSVGAHKAEAVKEQVELINPSAEVIVRLQRLGSQTSTRYLLDALSDIGECDLIVDTSGDAACFNYLAHIAERHHVPMIWGRVLAGGYGGYVVRSRPDVDPTPLVARERLDEWCADPTFPPAPARGSLDYEAAADDQPPMIADDADVSIITSHLSRFAIDLLVNPTESDYPCSAYMIGLRKEWIFNGPFDVSPINLGSPERHVDNAIEQITLPLNFSGPDQAVQPHVQLRSWTK